MRQFSTTALGFAFVLGGLGFASLSLYSQTSAPSAPGSQPAVRPQPPTRDPHSPGYVQAKQLPDGTVPPANLDGNFILGPTHTPAPEMTAPELTHGTVVEFTMESADSKYYPGIAREKGTF